MSIAYGRSQRVFLSCLLFSVAISSQAQTTAPAPSALVSPPVVTFNTLPVLQPTTPIPSGSRVPGDFNGDQTSDLVWFNPVLSEVGYWTMSATETTVPWEGSGVTLNATRSFNVTPGYFVGAVGDFNGDGFSDLVFTSAQHDLWLWTNNQHGGFVSTKIGTYPSNWQLVGSGDIDGDGNDDLLWMDAADCQFAYWTMRGATRTGFKIIPVTCGYYPISIGYYTPTNRLSILWTSVAGDLYIWDSTPSGFKSYNLSAYVNSPYFSFMHSVAIGGGYEGVNIGYVVYEKTTDGTYDAYQTASLSRSFDDQGNQTNVYVVDDEDGGAGPPPVNSGGYLIEGNGINATAIYYLSSTGQTLSTAGLPDSQPALTGPNAPFSFGHSLYGPTWTYPAGWFVVGAPGNVETTLPWQGP
jgi:hypothetical protein